MSGKSIEVFGMPNDFLLAGLGKPDPHVWNEAVNVKRYRVIVEEIEEPHEVYKERLQHLLANSTHLNYKAILAEAKRLGVTLD